ncbi:MAG: DUF3185 domain-containing protein [Gemmatimonadota bacterium]
MKPMSVFAGLLIVLGAFGLVYQGFTYTTRHKVLDLGPIQATAEEQHRIPVAPIVAAAALIGGIALLINSKQRR